MELCDQAGVTPRTVRYYVQQGLLPSPGKGPGTRYGRGHLDRLRLIRQLQKQHLPLAEIRKRVAGLDDAEVTAALRGAAASAPSPTTLHPTSLTPTSAVSDYVASVLGETHTRPLRSPPATDQPRFRAPYERDRWDRFRLTEDVEIHVRRPLSRETNRRVEELLEAAQKILGEET